MIAVGPYLLSAAAVKCLRDCAENALRSQGAYHPAVLKALNRRGLVRLYSSGSYLDGYTGGQHFVTLSDEGRRLMSAPSLEPANVPVEAGPTVLRWTSPRTGG